MRTKTTILGIVTGLLLIAFGLLASDYATHKYLAWLDGNQQAKGAQVMGYLVIFIAALCLGFAIGEQVGWHEAKKAVRDGRRQSSSELSE